jgi:Na+-translocating ferredoxin:NAD+ oxidoreductase RNF subunit RnfB
MKTILLSMLVLGVTGGIFGALLAFASKIFHVDVDPKQEKVRAALAGANCG